MVSIYTPQHSSLPLLCSAGTVLIQPTVKHFHLHIIMTGLRSGQIMSICNTEISQLPSVLTRTVTVPVCREEFRLIISYQPPSSFTPEQTLLIPFQIGLKRLISSIRTDKLCGEERDTHVPSGCWMVGPSSGPVNVLYGLWPESSRAVFSSFW